MEDVGDRSFYIEIRMQAFSSTTVLGGAEKKNDRSGRYTLDETENSTHPRVEKDKRAKQSMIGSVAMPMFLDGNILPNKSLPSHGS